jgi:serine/threonine protein kinase
MTFLDGFEVVEVLADHGARVTRRVRRDGQTFVLKTISLQASTSAKDLLGFEREAGVLRSLADDIRVPRVIDSRREDGDGDVKFHLLMEDLAGADLQVRIHRGEHPSTSVLIDWVLQAADQVAVLHRRSPPLIHRDLKPHNLLVDNDDKVWLLDFGSVKQTVGHSTTAGTFGFMAPEQLEGRASTRSDVYGLGMTLMALLTRKEPTSFEGGVRSTWRSHANTTPAIAAVVDQAISLDEGVRHVDAAAFAKALRQAVRGRAPVVAAPASTPSRAPWVVGAVLLSGVLMASGAIGFLVFSSEPSTTSSLVPRDPTPSPQIPPLPRQVVGLDRADARLGAPGLRSLRACREESGRLALSAQRYASWRKSLAEMPTCKERYVSYGLYTLGSLNRSCRIIPDVVTDPLRTAMVQMADSWDAAIGPLASASRYYENGDHADDACALGRKLHPTLLQHYAAGAAVDQTLRQLEDQLVKGMVAQSDDGDAKQTIEPLQLVHALLADVQRQAPVAQLVDKGRALQEALNKLPLKAGEQLPSYMGALREVEPKSIVASMHWDRASSSLRDLQERLMARLQ